MHSHTHTHSDTHTGTHRIDLEPPGEAVDHKVLTVDLLPSSLQLFEGVHLEHPTRVGGHQVTAGIQ